MILNSPSTDTVQSVTDNEQWVTDTRHSESLALNSLSHCHCKVRITGTVQSQSLTCIACVTDLVQSESMELRSPRHWHCIVKVTKITVLKSPALYFWIRWPSYHTLRIDTLGTESCNHRATVTTVLPHYRISSKYLTRFWNIRSGRTSRARKAHKQWQWTSIPRHNMQLP
jgi:hypothetical protein